MTAAQAAGARDAVGFERGERRGKGRDAGEMRTIRAGSRNDFGMAIDDKRDIARLHCGADRFHALDQAAFAALRESQQHGSDIAAAKRAFKLGRKTRGIVDERRDQIKPLAGRMSRHAALRSRSAFHCPSVARPFIIAR